MNRSLISELWYKMVHSGSRLNFFIGLNTIVFFALGILFVIQFLLSANLGYETIVSYLRLPSYLPALLIKPWTVFSYMFVHQDIFHFLFNMLGLYWFGRIFEDFLNSRQFTFTYLAGGLMGALFFVLFFNMFPAFQMSVLNATLIGASASVMAIIVATATLLPDYSLRLLLFGDVRLKFLAFFYVLFDLVTIAGVNGGGALAHLGGAFLGFVYIKQLQAGHDWSKMFQRKKRLKVVRSNSSASRRSANSIPDEEIIDQILDKISRSGYDSLTKQEKEQLFKASNKG